MNKPALECLKRTDSSWPDAYEVRGQPDCVCVALRWHNKPNGYGLLVEGSSQPHMTRDYSEYDAARQAFDEIVEMDCVTIERLQRMGFSA